MRLRAVLLVFFAAACAAPQAARRIPAPSQVTLALLPVNNHSSDLAAPALVRAALSERLRERGWRLINAAEVDAGLRTLGVTDGGQLRAFTTAQIREKVPADVLVYIDLLDFTLLSIGVLTRRRVEIRVRLVGTADEDLLWEGTGLGVQARAGAEAVADAALGLTGKTVAAVKKGAMKLIPRKTAGKKQLRQAGRLVDEITDYDLRRETRKAVRQLVAGIEEAIRLKQ